MIKLKKLLEELKIKTKISMDADDIDSIKKELDESMDDDETTDCKKEKIATLATDDEDDAGTVDDRTDNAFNKDNDEYNLVETGKAFKKLKNTLSHEKGVYDPAGLAASIGRKSMGKSKFQKKAVAGKKAHKK